jgi:hypothetical protein
MAASFNVLTQRLMTPFPASQRIGTKVLAEDFAENFVPVLRTAFLQQRRENFGEFLAERTQEVEPTLLSHCPSPIGLSQHRPEAQKGEAQRGS